MKAKLSIRASTSPVRFSQTQPYHPDRLNVNRNTLISRQGLVPLLAVVLAAILVLHFIGGGESLAFWVLALLVLVLFRDPERDVPSIPLSVLSPADGHVVSIEKTGDS